LSFKPAAVAQELTSKPNKKKRKNRSYRCDILFTIPFIKNNDVKKLIAKSRSSTYQTLCQHFLCDYQYYFQ
jgi:hypothetical protein